MRPYVHLDATITVGGLTRLEMCSKQEEVSMIHQQYGKKSGIRLKVSLFCCSNGSNQRQDPNFSFQARLRICLIFNGVFSKAGNSHKKKLFFNAYLIAQKVFWTTIFSRHR